MLTSREIEVLQLAALGMTTQSMARALWISPRTVGKHLENTYAKLGVHDRISALARVRRLGLLQEGT
jgi:DNA-binding CsgD family transcriptional regulator